jgi:hypothetical protein
MKGFDHGVDGVTRFSAIFALSIISAFLLLGCTSESNQNAPAPQSPNPTPIAPTQATQENGQANALQNNGNQYACQLDEGNIICNSGFSVMQNNGKDEIRLENTGYPMKDCERLIITDGNGNVYIVRAVGQELIVIANPKSNSTL